MAYGQKYSVLFATRANKDVELKIWQDSYVGAIIDLQGVDVNLQYIPSSDDPYEPIIASQLGVTIDFTDDLSDIINFTDINDRFTYVEMYVNSVIEWVGFVINDDVQISYSTGRKMAAFNATELPKRPPDQPTPDGPIFCTQVATPLFKVYVPTRPVLFGPPATKTVPASFKANE